MGTKLKEILSNCIKAVIGVGIGFGIGYFSRNLGYSRGITEVYNFEYMGASGRVNREDIIKLPDNYYIDVDNKGGYTRLIIYNGYLWADDGTKIYVGKCTPENKEWDAFPRE